MARMGKNQIINAKTYNQKEDVLRTYQPLVMRVATSVHKCSARFVDIEDLISVGMKSVWESINKYDPERGVPFMAFLTPRIRGAMIDEMRSMSWVPRRAVADARKLLAARDAIEKREKRSASDIEMSQELSVTIDKYHAMMNDFYNLSTIAAPFLRYDTVSIGEFFTPDPKTSGDDYGHLVVATMRDVLGDILQELPQMHVLVLSLYFLEGLSLDQIGGLLDYTESRISQFHVSAVKYIVARLREYVKEPE